MPRSDVALFLVPTLIWGSTWLAITFQLGTVAPEVSVAYRFALAAALLAAWCRMRGVALAFPLREHRWLALFGALFSGLNYLAVYWAERLVPSGLVAVVFSTVVFTSAIGMRVFFGEPVVPRVIAGGVLGVAGVALVFLPALEQHAIAQPALGIGLAFAASVSATLGSLVAVRNHRAGLAAAPATAWGMAYGALVAAIAATLGGARWTFEATPSYVLSLLYLAVLGSVVAFTAYLELLKRAGAARASFVGVSTPVIALVLSSLFEDYRFTPAGVAGVTLAVAGNVLALRAKR